MAVQAAAVIKQRELQDIHELRIEISDKQARLDSMTESLKALLFARAPIEPGRFDARLSFKMMRNPSWKQVVIDELGAEFMESVRLSTPPVRRCEVVIIEHAIPPLWKQADEQAGSQP